MNYRTNQIYIYDKQIYLNNIINNLINIKQKQYIKSKNFLGNLCTGTKSYSSD